MPGFTTPCKVAVQFQCALDDDDCVLVRDQSRALPTEAWPANQFYDIWPWQGTLSYVAGIWLATLSAASEMAKVMGDGKFAADCSSRLGKAINAFEANLWNGTYYRLWNDHAQKPVSEVCLANQLMAAWCTRIAGLQDPIPIAHVNSALDSIGKLNMKATSYGLINGVMPDGKPFETGLGRSGDHAKNIFFGENLCAAMTFLYYGWRDTGLQIAERLYSAVAVKNNSPWNQRCLLNGETGLQQWGEDYYSNLVIWALPMAVYGQSLDQFARAGLVENMLRSTKEA